MAVWKKIFKVFLAVLMALCVLVAVVVFVQWDNINAVISGIKETSEEITKKREENNKELVDKVNEYMEKELREPTKEEKEQILSGESTVAEVFSKIISENTSTVVEYDTEKDEFVETEKTPETDKNPPGDSKPIIDNKQEKEESSKKNQDLPADKKSAEDIVNKYISQLYALETAYTAKAQGLISSGAKFYNGLVKNGQDRASARASTISQFTGPVRGAMTDCDAKVESVISELEAELKAVGADTSIVETVRKTYASEKQLKLSYYSNKYLK